ncbi:MAG: hypothetical protein EOM11_09565 [Erysipelotrichia bacterium]|nr:hypothetical protein [Erysipelotrichia bacterium]
MVTGEEVDFRKPNPTPKEQEAIKKLENVPIGYILYRVFGCKTKAEWDTIKIVDLLDPSRVSNEKILEMRIEFTKTKDYLTIIKDKRNDYHGRIPTGRTTFSWWWIPFDVFPHDDKIDDVSKNNLYLK